MCTKYKYIAIIYIYTSAPYTDNDIWQLGILSPYLYNVYTDDLSVTFCDTGISCHIHDWCINSISYTDDMVLLKSSAHALQDLINVFQVYAAKHDIVYNTNKIKCMLVPPASSKGNYLESVQLSGRALTFVDSFTN